MNQHNLNLTTFNCRSVKRSLNEVHTLCDSCDFLFMQEHWLLPGELDILNGIHSDFYSIGYSAVELTNDVLIGRPYGGTCILYRKHLSHYVSKVDSYDPRITAVNFSCNIGLVLMICVYMPTDYGTYESYEQYADTCAKIVALYEDSESVNVILCGDFNCQPGSRFYSLYVDLMTHLNLVESDVNRLKNFHLL